MTDSDKVDAFLEKQTQWKTKLTQLREIFKKTELKEEVKWGKPTYTYKGKMVAAISDFKNHIALWFHQGVFLQDKKEKLVNAQEGVTKALRQWRFTKEDEIDENLVAEYINEAIENTKAGKELKKTAKKPIEIPQLLREALEKDKLLQKNFQALAPSCRREYSEYIAEAKQESTKIRRLAKILPLIMEKKGLHDKYKKA
ncbi:DUF1801 domain-containing protein [Aequorivita echinoideorum]|uniref:DUF1801 domain-containing protein n=2 Tax=Aequorivita echinoideorum TaxID=1549647 RepID=A0ABS5S5D4_9FLAO|nr:DUF1801 domain-containing protein [Aequorivita echinoideorum]